MQDHLLTLPAPPNPDELEEIRRKLSMSFKSTENHTVPQIQTVAVTTGWSPSPANAIQGRWSIRRCGVLKLITQLFRCEYRRKPPDRANADSTELHRSG